MVLQEYYKFRETRELPKFGVIEMRATKTHYFLTEETELPAVEKQQQRQQ